MGTILLRLAAPIQAWGDESKYDIRGTRNEPTKSGVIGLLAAAMGCRRDSGKIIELADNFRIGIRTDQPGTVIRDFHTAKAPKYSKSGTLRYESDGSVIMEKDPYITSRYYLCDACFLVGLESENMELLHAVEEALKSPRFPIYLGRRSCPPSLPIFLGITEVDLETALHEYEWIAADWYKKKVKSIHACINTETLKGETAWHIQMDQPVSFSPVHRKYTVRGLNKEKRVLLSITEHDPMAAL